MKNRHNAIAIVAAAVWCHLAPGTAQQHPRLAAAGRVIIIVAIIEKRSRWRRRDADLIGGCRKQSDGASKRLAEQQNNECYLRGIFHGDF